MSKTLGADDLLRFLNQRGAWVLTYTKENSFRAEAICRGVRHPVSVSLIEAMSKAGELRWSRGGSFTLSDFGKKVAAKYPKWVKP